MKIISICEREFIVNCITRKSKRLDGRDLFQGRNLEIAFGQERGCCIIMQGNTRVLAQVSSEVTEPKPTAPREGALHINLELSSMASPEAKSQMRTSDEAVEYQRSLERCVRDSKCIDLESLCIVAGLKVWTIRVDIHILNDDGNLIECASIAAVSALAHFRRPDVTAIGTEVTVHSPEDRDTVPLNLLHMPLSVNLALFKQGEYILVDPTEIEEKVCDGCYIIGMNAHQEICFIHRRGVLLLQEEVVQRCENAAVQRAQAITQIIRGALDDDAYKRLTNTPVGFTNILQTGTILGAKHPMPEIDLNALSKHRDLELSSAEPQVITVQDDDDTVSNRTLHMKASSAKEHALRILNEPEVVVFEGGISKWGVESDEDESSEEHESPKEMMPSKSNKQDSLKEESEFDSEEETVFINEDQVDVKMRSRGWYSSDPFA